MDAWGSITLHFVTVNLDVLITTCMYLCMIKLFIQACTSVDLSSEESKTKMIHMSKMFQMYATKEFTNGRDIWLAGICRYLNDAYTTLATKVHVTVKPYYEHH